MTNASNASKSSDEKSLYIGGVNATANQVGGADTPNAADDLYKVTVLEGTTASPL